MVGLACSWSSLLPYSRQGRLSTRWISCRNWRDFLQNGSDRGGTNIPLTPALSATGYAFGYWTVNGVRQAGADGRSLTQISSVINGTTTYKAYYFAESADTDGDGIKDWFEYRMWGDLSQAGGEIPTGMDFQPSGK